MLEQLVTCVKTKTHILHSIQKQLKIDHTPKYNSQNYKTFRRQTKIFEGLGNTTSQIRYKKHKPWKKIDKSGLHQIFIKSITLFSLNDSVRKQKSTTNWELIFIKYMYYKGLVSRICNFKNLKINTKTSYSIF